MGGSVFFATIRRLSCGTLVSLRNRGSLRELAPWHSVVAFQDGRLCGTISWDPQPNGRTARSGARWGEFGWPHHEFLPILGFLI
jgi:hypothetical protein